MDRANGPHKESAFPIERNCRAISSSVRILGVVETGGIGLQTSSSAIRWAAPLKIEHAAGDESRNAFVVNDIAAGRSQAPGR